MNKKVMGFEQFRESNLLPIEEKSLVDVHLGMKYFKTFEGLFDRFKKQESSASKIYSAIENGEMTDVIKEEKPGTIGSFNIVKFKLKGTSYSISRTSSYNNTKYALKMGNMELDCSQKISESIYKLLWQSKLRKAREKTELFKDILSKLFFLMNRKVMSFEQFCKSKSPSTEEKGTHELVNAHYSENDGGALDDPKDATVKGGSVDHTEPADEKDMTK